MDYSILLMVVKIDALDEFNVNQRPYILLSKNEYFAFVLGIIDYL